MRIPLIVAGARIGNGPFAYLRSGKWTFDVSSHDSRISISTDCLPEQDARETTLELFALTPVRAIVHDLGSSPHVTVYACLSH